MKRIRYHDWKWAIFALGLVVGVAAVPGSDANNKSRDIYWFFSLNDAAEIQFHGSALSEPVGAGKFVQSLPSDSGGTLYLMIEGSTGWFLDALEPDDAVVSSGASVSVAAGAAVGGSAPEETKTRTVDLLRIWAHDDDFNDIASWTFQSAELVGRSMSNTYVVRVNYPSVEIGSVN